MTEPVIASWNSFFAAEVGAAATLSGLVIVAVSINLARILATPTLPGRALETLTMLTGIMIAASFGLAPGQPKIALGSEFIGVGVAMWLTAISLQRRAGRGPGEPRWSRALRIALGQASSLPFVAAGLSLILNWPGGLYWLVLGVACCLFGSVFNSWVLLVEIVR